MTIARATLAVVAGIAVLATAAPARAQSAEAEALFRDGKRLMKEGKIAEACDKLDASNRLESSVGTLLNLADCREKNNQLATAWATFLKASTAAKQSGKPDKREAEARRRAALLEPRLAYLTISVADANKADGLVVKRNGAVVDPALWNTAVPVDAGTYEIASGAPGHKAWSTKVEINAEGQKATVEAGKDPPPPPKPVAVPAPPPSPVAIPTPPPKPVAIPTPPKPVVADREPAPAGASPDAQIDASEQPSQLTTMRKAAIGAAVVGVAGIVVGGIYGAKGQSLEKQSNDLCPGTSCNNMMGVQLNADARSDATIANIGIIGGGVVIAGAAVMWFVGAPKVAGEPVSIAPVVRGDEVGLAVGGRF